MAIYRLFEEPVFPDPEEADPDGLLAIGGDLSPERLLTGYACGIFPWYSENSPILWWSTDPRLVLEPARLHISASLRRVLNSGRFEVTFDQAFDQVIAACATTPRPGQNGTWIVPEMLEAYTRLHSLGFAHSAEAWLDGKLVGGIYGVGLGCAFFGESMFHRAPNASKVALVALASRLRQHGYCLIDCQQTTPHMQRFGAVEISRREFLRRLEVAVNTQSPRGCWPAPKGREAHG